MSVAVAQNTTLPRQWPTPLSYLLKLPVFIVKAFYQTDLSPLPITIVQIQNHWKQLCPPLLLPDSQCTDLNQPLTPHLQHPQHRVSILTKFYSITEMSPMLSKSLLQAVECDNPIDFSLIQLLWNPPNRDNWNMRFNCYCCARCFWIWSSAAERLQ